jgi:hypothetical protein
MAGLFSTTSAWIPPEPGSKKKGKVRKLRIKRTPRKPARPWPPEQPQCAGCGRNRRRQAPPAGRFPSRTGPLYCRRCLQARYRLKWAAAAKARRAPEGQ